MTRKKILLVDDSSTVLMMERFILRNGPYILITASSGAEAIQKAESESPDLILLDVDMPRMTGYEVCRAVRTIEALKDIPIILVTPRTPAPNAESAGATDWTASVSKPINAIELLAKVSALLGV